MPERGQGVVPAENHHAEAPGERAAEPSHEEQERQARVIEEE